MNTLFHFNQHQNQRRKKIRGALRHAFRAVSDPKRFERVLSSQDWFHHYHQHLDWDGLGDLSFPLRHIFLEAHARMFRHFALQAHLLEKPYQLWITLLTCDAAQDAVYLHTPNPHSIFPAVFSHIQWGLPELETIFTPWLPEFSLIAGRSNGVLFIYAEGRGTPLKPEAISAE